MRNTSSQSIRQRKNYQQKQPSTNMVMPSGQNQGLKDSPNKAKIGNTSTTEGAKNIQKANPAKSLLQKPPPLWDKPVNVEKVKRMSKSLILYPVINDEVRMNQKNMDGEGSKTLIEYQESQRESSQIGSVQHNSDQDQSQALILNQEQESRLKNVGQKQSEKSIISTVQQGLNQEHEVTKLDDQKKEEEKPSKENPKPQRDSNLRNSKQNKNEASIPYKSIHRHKNTAFRLCILTNRINRLIQEENQLNKRADEIENRIVKQYYNKLRAEQLKEQKALIAVEEIPFTNPVKQMEIAKCQLSRQYVIDTKREEALAVKMSLARMNNQKMKNMIRQESCLRDQVLKVQHEEFVSKQKQHNFYVDKVNRIRIEQEEEMKQQEIIEAQDDELLKQLEVIEFEQLARLNQTKRRTKDAQIQLQFQQNHDVKEFEQRFGEIINKSKEQDQSNTNKESQEKTGEKPKLYYLKKDKDGVMCIHWKKKTKSRFG